MTLPRRPLAASCLALLVAAGAVPAQPDSRPSAARILDAADAAVGGQEARRSAETLLCRGTVAMKGMPGKGSFQEAWRGAGAARFTFEYPGCEGASTQGTTGRFTWSTDPAMGVHVVKGAEQGAARRLFGICRRVPWRTLYEEAGLEGRVELDGRPHHELAMKAADGTGETWYVDCETHVLSRVDIALPDFQGGTIDMQFGFEDWKRVRGLLLPHRKTQKAGVYEIVFTYESVEPGAGVTPEMVAPPKDVLAALDDPSRRTPAPSGAGACKVEEVPSRPVASIRVRVAKSDVGKTLAVLLPEVMAHLGKVGAVPAGPPFTRYHDMGDDVLDIEAGIPVREPVEGAGRVKASRLPGGRAAVTWHVGDYEKLPRAYALLEGWLEKRGLEPRGAFWEVYWTDPGLEPDRSKWRVQIVWPVK